MRRFEPPPNVAILAADIVLVAEVLERQAKEITATLVEFHEGVAAALHRATARLKAIEDASAAYVASTRPGASGKGNRR